MAFLQSIQNSSFAEWVLVSFWGFPVMIALHSIGMGIAVGLGSFVALRVNGVFAELPVGALKSLIRFAWYGFALNLVTGVILLIGRISEYLVDLTFLVKMALVLASAGFLFVIQRALMATGYSKQQLDRSVRLMAWLSIFTWLGAVATGRWIAYLSSLYV